MGAGTGRNLRVLRVFVVDRDWGIRREYCLGVGPPRRHEEHEGREQIRSFFHRSGGDVFARRFGVVGSSTPCPPHFNQERRIVKMGKIEFDALSNRVIGCAIEVHRELGPGLLESAYARCLRHELGLNGIEFEFERELPVEYKGIHLDCGYRIDLYFNGSLIVELKSVAAIEPIHEAQLITYLKLSKVGVGLLINFNVPRLKDGIRRFVR
jgi:GxxExxY protein